VCVAINSGRCVRCEPVLVGEDDRLCPVAQPELGEHSGETWVFTVASLTVSCAAISALVSPRLIRDRTSVSRAVRWSISVARRGGRERRANAPTTRRVTDGDSRASPCATPVHGVDRITSVNGLGHRLDVEDHPEAAAHELLVVGQHDPDRPGPGATRPGATHGRPSSACTRKPPFGRAPISSRPPCMVTRARMPTRPRPPERAVRGRGRRRRSRCRQTGCRSARRPERAARGRVAGCWSVPPARCGTLTVPCLARGPVWCPRSRVRRAGLLG
jgi:hypothetical protein